MRLQLPDSLHYPITVTELLQRPDDQIDQATPLFSYFYRTTVTEGDRYGEEHQVEKTFPSRYESPVEGILKSWKIKEGAIIRTAHIEVAEIEEPCKHGVQYGGMCTICGKDMTKVTYNTDISNAARAKINMTHDNNLLTISQEEATRVEEEAKRRLLQSKKLSLVVDLDQTIIHATVDPTVAEWQAAPDNPNYSAVKDVRQFRLADEGPSGKGCWYFIKLRPGLAQFLETISKFYELHIYTMGTRAYARHIAAIVDPDRKIFGDRILSRDESGSLTAKNLQRLFPVDTKMVVIIDDRGDVWKWSDNLIKVTPYDFFVGIGDINSSFLPKKPEIQASENVTAMAASEASEDPVEGTTAEGQEGKGAENGTDPSTQPTDSQVTTGSDVSTLEQLVSMGGGDDPSILQEQASKQDQALAAQLEDRPLLQQQKKLDAEEVASASSSESGRETPTTNSPTAEEQSEPVPHRHNLLQDDDSELQYLEQSLKEVHRTFFEEYDAKLERARGSRVAKLRGETNGKKMPSPDAKADLEAVPDVKNIMPQMKLRVLEGVVLVLSGVVPLGNDIQRSDIALWAKSFGARISLNVNKHVTHVVAARNRTAKVRQAARMEQVRVVRTQWLLDSISQWRRLEETPYLITLHPEDLKPRPSDGEKGDPIRDDGSLSSSDEDDDGELDEDGEDDGRDDTDDLEGVVPDELEENLSPVDGFKSYDWKEVNDDLADFLGSDNEDSEDDNSVASESTLGNTTPKKRKRSRSASRSRDPVEGNGTNGDEAGENALGSPLAKRQQLAKARTTGLKSVASAPGDAADAAPSSAATNNDDGGSYNSADRRKSIDEMDDDEFAKEIEADIEKEFDFDEE